MVNFVSEVQSFIKNKPLCSTADETTNISSTFESGEELPVGKNEIQYKAGIEKFNITATCVFTVTIQKQGKYIQLYTTENKGKLSIKHFSSIFNCASCGIFCISVTLLRQNLFKWATM